MGVGVVKFIRQVRKEANSVVWSSRKAVFSSLLMVLLAVALFILFFITVDYIVYKLIHNLILGY